MSRFARVLTPELLDSLPPEDPAAVRSRADLRRVNWWMRNHSHVARAIMSLPRVPATIIELGAGDGTFMLRVAELLQRPRPAGVRLYLLDMKPVVSEETLAAFAKLGWQAEGIRANLHEWIQQPSLKVDLVSANLFLHHFTDGDLAKFFRAFSDLTDAFIACEPRRWRPSVIGTKFLWCIGCNHVTRHDADASVRAGFREKELSALWPSAAGFQLREEPAGVASHLFTAWR